ncbi:transglycosylase SLT domain-containing protein [Dyella subtropica]|uniref:transglycosylase SLT domain-containing protein n=1 Tax=Dyella subtropica TaxID=2992127 RepID=UPI002B1CC3B0|nr:transglycosylase SLT domain-containing protein [Dyella subtropica]
MKRPSLRPLPIVLSTLLAACASAPSQLPRTSASAGNLKPPHPTISDVTHNVGGAATPLETSNVWEQLRSSFAMADCDADPAILDWARRYTQSPQRFEAQMREVMPRLIYVQQIAAKHGVAGEFALLPWVESRYRPMPGSKGSPAGMWQIMQATANALGMRVDKNYDGRLDVPAATDAMMALLKRYHDDLGDWRLADYAYNAGEFAIRRLIDQHGAPAAEPIIPKMPVKRITREHLTKLLAISCVVREPGRFKVNLPLLPAEQHLVSVDVDQSMPIAQAANHAGMSVDELKDLNAGFRNGFIDKRAASYLLMPRNHAEQFRNAPLQTGNDTASTYAAGLSPLMENGDGPSPVAGDDSAPSPGNKTHTVKSGETLWIIARRYSLNVDQLKRWNHLQDAKLRLGQILKISAPG